MYIYIYVCWGYRYESVKSNGVPTCYVAFEGEQHGFRQQKNIKKAIEGMSTHDPPGHLDLPCYVPLYTCTYIHTALSNSSYSGYHVVTSPDAITLDMIYLGVCLLLYKRSFYYYYYYYY